MTFCHTGAGRCGRTRAPTAPRPRSGSLRWRRQLGKRGAALCDRGHRSTSLGGPWSLTCTALQPTPACSGFPAQRKDVSKLQSAADPDDRCAMMLRTTRGKDVERLVAVVKMQLRQDARIQRRVRAAGGSLPRDHILRLRVAHAHEVNYGDSAMFYVGTLTPEAVARLRERDQDRDERDHAPLRGVDRAEGTEATGGDCDALHRARPRAHLGHVIVPGLQELGVTPGHSAH